jgi:hypothetical protein
MPIFPAVAGTIRFALEQIQANQPMVNIIHLAHSVTTPLTKGECDSVAEHVGNAFEANMYPQMSAESGLRQVVATQLDSVTAPQGIWPFNGAGALGGGLGSLATARVVKEVIPRRYRGGHPRFYWGGVRQADVEPTNGRALTSAAAAASSVAATNFWAALNSLADRGDAWEVVCVHYFSRHGLLAVPIQDTVSGFSVDPVLGTQRRRLQR